MSGQKQTNKSQKTKRVQVRVGVGIMFVEVWVITDNRPAQC